MKRYTCPHCGKGRNAPGRMAPDDVRRFCLPCSEATGKLVSMACPARETAKRQAAEKAKARAKAKREKEREAFMLPDGTDLRRLGRRLRYLKCWQFEGRAVDRAIKLCVNVHKNQEARHAETGTEAALGMLNILCHKACEYLPIATDLATHRHLFLASACEYFGLDPEIVRRHALIVDRLKGQGENGADHVWKYKRAILALEAAKAATP